MKSSLKFTALLLILSLSACNKTENVTKTHDHEAMMKALGAPKLNIKTVGILLYDGYNTLDAMGPYQVLSEMMGTEVFLLVKKKA